MQENACGEVGLPPERAIRIAGEVTRGLDYAHRRGLLHCDIKPASILLSESGASEFGDGVGRGHTAEGDEQRVLLTDFGVAKAANETESLTVVGDGPHASGTGDPGSNAVMIALLIGLIVVAIAILVAIFLVA